MAKSKLYLLLSAACTAGYIWILVAYNNSVQNNAPAVCLFKKVTGIPCPSCGSTRSVLSILHFHFAEALLWNPLGIFIVLSLLVVPFWIAFDLLGKNDSLHRFYYKTEQVLKQKKIAIPLILLVIVNWIWNIYKGL